MKFVLLLSFVKEVFTLISSVKLLGSLQEFLKSSLPLDNKGKLQGEYFQSML